jgi:hypothetical protein
MKRYPRRIQTLKGNGGRRVVTVYETAPGKFSIYLKVDGRSIGVERRDSKGSALATARAWT